MTGVETERWFVVNGRRTITVKAIIEHVKQHPFDEIGWRYALFNYLSINKRPAQILKYANGWFVSAASGIMASGPNSPTIAMVGFVTMPPSAKCEGPGIFRSLPNSAR